MKLKMQVFGGPWKAPWHYYSNVFGVYIVPKLEIVPGPLGGSVLASKRPPFLSQKSNNFFQRAAKRGFGASQDDTEGEEKGVQKWTQKKIGQKSGESQKQASRPPYTERFQVHGEGYREG